MDKRDRCTADDAADDRRDDAHHDDQYRKEATELVFAQCDEGDNGGARMYKNGGEKCPKEDMVPHFAECV